MLIWAITSLLAATIGPFTTYTSFGFAERLTYWGGLIGLAMVSGYLIHALIARATGLGRDTVKVDLLCSIGQSLTLGPLIWAFNSWVLGMTMGTVLWFLEHIGVVLLVCLAIVSIRQHLRRTRIVEAVEPSPASEEIPNVAFLKRLDAELGQELLRVSADDHYLLVVTRVGEGRVLMRFRDALDELADLPGYQIHRSHWVARDAVVSVRQDGRRHMVELPCGDELPVSRAYLDTLRADGLVA